MHDFLQYIFIRSPFLVSLRPSVSARILTFCVWMPFLFAEWITGWRLDVCVCARFFVCLVQLHVALSMSIFATYQKIENFLLMQFTLFASALQLSHTQHTFALMRDNEERREQRTCTTAQCKLHGFSCCCVPISKEYYVLYPEVPDCAILIVGLLRGS